MLNSKIYDRLNVTAFWANREYFSLLSAFVFFFQRRLLIENNHTKEWLLNNENRAIPLISESIERFELWKKNE